MISLRTSFADAARSKDMFASKALILQNAAGYEQNILSIIEKYDLPVARIAFQTHMDFTDNLYRKNKITPRKFHEYGLVDNIDKMFACFGKRWINTSKYGSIDALISAALLHDLREDFSLSSNQIRRRLENGIENTFNRGEITLTHHDRAYKDIDQTVLIVDALSRNQGVIMLQEGDRVAQAREWLTHPYAYLIKQLDWADKLSTMIGVERFEKNNQERMGVILSETALLFVKEQQDMTSKAIAKYPTLAPCYKAMDGIIGILFQGLRTYTTITAKHVGFDLDKASPFNFQGYLTESLRLLRKMHRGNNFISPVADDLETMGMENPRVQQFLQRMYRPALPDLNVKPSIDIVMAYTNAALDRASFGYHTIKDRLSSWTLSSRL